MAHPITTLTAPDSQTAANPADIWAPSAALTEAADLVDVEQTGRSDAAA